jgi:hypothetical protein
MGVEMVRRPFIGGGSLSVSHRTTRTPSLPTDQKLKLIKP